MNESGSQLYLVHKGCGFWWCFHSQVSSAALNILESLETPAKDPSEECVAVV